VTVTVFAHSSAYFCRFLPPRFFSSEVAEALDSSGLAGSLAGLDPSFP